MERKAKLYDHLRKTGISGKIFNGEISFKFSIFDVFTNFTGLDDKLAEEVLVDFDRKAWEQPSVSKQTTNLKILYFILLSLAKSTMLIHL